MNEQLYIFVDITGHCFEDFQESAGDEPSSARNYYDCVGAMLRGEKEFGVGDMMAFKGELEETGFT